MPVIGGADSVPDPVIDPCQGLVRDHVFFRHLRGKKASFDGFRAGLEGLTDAFFAELVAVTPAEWTTGAAAGKLDQIVDVLQKRRDAVEQWLPKVQAWLDR